MRDVSRTNAPFAEFEASESVVRSYCRDLRAVFARAVNARLWDEDGVEYIDFLSACGSLNYGHNHPALKHVHIPHRDVEKEHRREAHVHDHARPAESPA